MKKFFLLSVLIFLCADLFSQNLMKPDYVLDDKRRYHDALVAFEKQNYSDAIKFAEEAKRFRKDKIAWEVYTLKNSFKPAEVKVQGDNIFDVVKVLKRREDYDALEIIDAYKKIYGYEAFNNSCKDLISFIEKKSVYPEAEVLEGLIYKLEGEYDIAEQKLMKAFLEREILDVPEEKYDILYALSEISFTKKDFKKYEEDLILIISQDKSYKDESLKKAMKLSIESTKADCLEKFFIMYRTENFRLLNAYTSLTEYYLSKNENNRALITAALGTLTGFSKIYDVIKKRNPEYEYTNLASLLIEASSYDDIVTWGKDNKVWEGFNCFAETAFKNQNSIFATKLYSVLKEHSPEEYWRMNASVRLDVITGKSKN